MVSGDRIAEHRQNARALNILHRLRLSFHLLEEGRRPDIGGVKLPAVSIGGFHFNRFPFIGAFKHFRILFTEHVGGHLLHRAGDFLPARPDIFQVDRIAFAIVAQRIGGEVDIHITRQRIGYDQRRRRQPVRFHQRMDTTFKVTVTGEHGPDGQIAFFNRLLDRIRQRTGVTNTGGTAVADQVKAQLVEIRRQARLREIIRYHFGSRGQRGFDPRLTLQPQGDGFFRQQTGRHQHARVRGVGTGGDRGDYHRTVRKLILMTVQHIVYRLTIFLRGIQFQLAAGGKGFRYIAESNAILRTFRAGKAGFDGAHIQFKGACEYRLIARLTPHPLRFGIGFHQCHLIVATTAQAHVIQRYVINREETAGGAIFRRHVGDGCAVGQRQ